MGAAVQPTRTEQFIDTAKLSWQHTPISNAIEKYSENLELGAHGGMPVAAFGPWPIFTEPSAQQKQWDPPLSPDQANKQFPGMPTPFNEPIYPEVAKLQYDHYQRQKDLQDWVTAGAPMPTWMQFGAGVAGSLPDPTNLLFGEVAAPLEALAGVARAGKLAKLSVEFGGALGFNKAMEEAMKPVERSEHLAPQDSTPLDTLEGTVATMGLFHGIKLMGDSFATGVSYFKNTPPELQTQNARTALAQHEAGVNMNLSPGDLETNARLHGSDPENPVLQPGQEGEALKQSMDPKNARFLTPEIEKSVHDLRHGEVMGSDPAKVDQVVQQQYDDAMAKLKEQAKENPAIEKGLESMKEDETVDRKEKSLMQKFADCVGSFK
jgi:hypothetical protein